MKGYKEMNIGYVRLSKDDDKRNYVSIENQKLIITQYATTQNEVIDKWYEDDGFSGYSFERPGFQELIKDINTLEHPTVYVKDFSRLGRHNAKVLLLLDEFSEHDQRLIVIDDNYDSSSPDDDTIGIKTWYNERYVKDTSKKIRSALNARQKEGTLLTLVPFGYIRNTKDKETIEIAKKEADYIKMIFTLYIQGSGYRKISGYLTEQKIPTPSIIRREYEIKQGKSSKRQIATEWSDGMIKDILGNDFYIGTYRLHKRARKTIHGKNQRVPKEEQYIFENHHPAIIDSMTFELVQELKQKRVKTNYRGSHGQWIDNQIPTPFGSCLFCKDCGNRLTPIKRKTATTIRKYYICSTYNTKGKKHCPTAHLIDEQDLMRDVTNYIILCRDALAEIISVYNMKDFESEKKSVEAKRNDLQDAITVQKKLLKTLFSQKLKDLTTNSENEELIKESYDSLQNDILTHIHAIELKLKDLNETTLETPDVKKKLRTALDVVDEIIQKDLLDRRDIEILIERIDVDENGFPDIELKYGLSGFIKCSPTEKLNRKENEIILTTMQIIKNDTRGYTSARYLSIKLKDHRIEKSNKAIIPYINLMIADGILEHTDNPIKPYTILKSNKELERLIAHLHDEEGNRWYATDGI